ncbi:MULTISPECIES: rhamnogalacturonan acetylesterase [Reichenbachiella]|uniref:Lysophospholipase L1 n=1 Tax=Reichenbachiella agariperforans TaxID=156994 RepID=A0A1M6V2U0_REIAG|nr:MULTISPECIES: rhamnogalacturonan acetylesterase [Reichenbachiella]RJE72751.1 rhamnogalacturonan acetylesterase [Reichenbachiella sp. MSK19-1]SHK75827.1 Lysophospholipase L1 [Reichenbachiella agariperforans]
MLKYFLIFLLTIWMSGCHQQESYTLHLVGDSTMADKKDPELNPEHGWGQVLPSYFDSAVTVVNHAVNGRSTKSFIEEGKWDRVKAQIKSGDYVFIQFGHNDQKSKDAERYTNPYTGYRNNLKTYVTEAHALGAKPVLFSSIVRRKFNEEGVLIDTHGVYPYVMRQLAIELDVPFVDMQWYSEQLVASMGDPKSKELYLWLEPGESSYKPEGKQDDTHFSKYGAQQMAQLAIKEMKNQGFPFVKYLKAENLKTNN